MNETTNVTFQPGDVVRHIGNRIPEYIGKIGVVEKQENHLLAVRPDDLEDYRSTPWFYLNEWEHTNRVSTTHNLWRQNA